MYLLWIIFVFIGGLAFPDNLNWIGNYFNAQNSIPTDYWSRVISGLIVSFAWSVQLIIDAINRSKQSS